MPSERPAMIAQSDAARDWQPRAEALVTGSAEPFRLLTYRARVWLMASGASAIHCRFCCRRHCPDRKHVPDRERLAGGVGWLRGRGNIGAVILTGGDPLRLSARRLRELLAALAGLP